MGKFVSKLRDGSRRTPRNRPPAEEPWIWLTRQMLHCAAFRGLGINPRRVLDFLMLEHMSHAGLENGRLYAPYLHLVAFGVPKSEICAALDELEAFGFIEMMKGTRLGGRSQASRYRLTWLPTADGEPASNRWKKITRAAVDCYRSDRRKAKMFKRERKLRGKELIALEGGMGGKILKDVREIEPTIVRLVEPGG